MTKEEILELEEEYLDDFKAPYVKQSRIKLGCAFENEYFIKENDCIFVIGKVQHIYVLKYDLQNIKVLIQYIGNYVIINNAIYSELYRFK